MAPKKKAKTVQKDVGPWPRTRAFAIEEGSHHVGESPRLPGAFDDRHRTPKKPSKHTLRDFYLTPLPLGYKSASKSHLAPEVADVRGKNVDKHAVHVHADSGNINNTTSALQQ